MNIEKKIDLYLKEDFDVSTAKELSNVDAMSFSTGIKRMNLFFSRANTPRKYAIAFEIANDMVQKFPLKANLVFKAIADAYSMRFGGQ